MFIGYNGKSKAYRLLDPLIGKIIINKDVSFHEDKRWDFEDKDGVTHITTNEDGQDTDGKNVEPHHHIESQSHIVDSTHPGDSEYELIVQYKSVQELYKSCYFALTAADPEFFEEAMKHQAWKVAIDKEIASIIKNNTWSLTKLTESKKPVDIK